MDSMQSHSENYAILVPTTTESDKRSRKDLVNRLSAYVTWLDEHGGRWMYPRLREYRAYLLHDRRLASTSVNAHLATIRNRYRTLLDDGTIHSALENAEAGDMSDYSIDYSLRTIREAIRGQFTYGAPPTDKPEHLRLTSADIARLIENMFTHSIVGVRDQAIIALMYTTGLRENELCALDVKDLYHLFMEKPALHVPKKRACVERLIPYGDLIWGLHRVNEWLEEAEIYQGPVFRGSFKGGMRLRRTRLSVRSLEYILASYPLTIDDHEVHIRPMDLRRAYARLLFESDMELGAIRDNLGLKDINTVLDYIGGGSEEARIPVIPNAERSDEDPSTP